MSCRSTTQRSLQRLSQLSRRTTPRRPYHSHEHPSTPRQPTSRTEDSILASAYKHVPEHGFSQTSLSLGARDAGYIDISPSVLPDGPFALINYHLVAQRNNLAAAAREAFQQDESSRNGGGGKGVGRRVAQLTWLRLMANRDVIRHWQEALAIMAQPSHVPASLRELAKLSDEIWFLAGDTAVDSSWYTKRASLSMVYSTSELYMTNDTSPEFEDTHKFLHRRLNEVQEVGGALGSIGQWAGFTFNAGVNVLRSKGLRI